jgi:hypothetical protein
MSFAVVAVYLLIAGGFHWRAVVASSIATVATAASRYLFAGRPDPRLEEALKQNDSESKGGTPEISHPRGVGDPHR